MATKPSLVSENGLRHVFVRFKKYASWKAKWALIAEAHGIALSWSPDKGSLLLGVPEETAAGAVAYFQNAQAVDRASAVR